MDAGREIAEILPDARVLSARSKARAKPLSTSRRTASVPQLLTRASLDGRTGAARAFDQLVDDIHADLGGSDALSAIEKRLVEAFAGAAITLDSLNTRMLLGEKIDLAEHAQACSAMVRVASRLGLSRRAKDVGPSLSDYLAEDGTK